MKFTGKAVCKYLNTPNEGTIKKSRHSAQWAFILLSMEPYPQEGKSPPKRRV